MTDGPDPPAPPPPPPPPPPSRPGAGAGPTPPPPPPPPPPGPSDQPTQAKIAAPPPPPPPQAAGPARCPNCGAETADGQQVCVECGQDLSRAYRRAPGWRLWVVAGVVGVLAVGVGAGFAIGALTNDKQKKKAAQASATAAVPTLPAPTPPPPSTPAATPPTTPTAPAPGEPTATTPAPTTPATPPAPATPGGSAIASWPAGKTGYTVILISAKKHSQATAKAKEAKSRGIDAGVLHSNDYSSLTPGYWVVFAGQYASSKEASSHIDEYASKGFPGGYPRQIKK